MGGRRKPKPAKWIDVRKDGKWVVRFLDKRGIECKAVRRDRQHAELEFLRRTGPASVRHVGACHVASLVEWFKLEQKHRRVRTDADYNNVRNWFAPRFGDRTIGSMTIADLAAYRSWLNGLTKPTPENDPKARYSSFFKDKCVRTMRRMFRLAGELGLLEHNPAAMLGGRPKQARGVRGKRGAPVKVRPPTHDELKIMHGNAPPWLSAAIALLSETGAKGDELDALIESDAEYEHRAINISHEMAGGKRVLIEHERCRRIVPVSDGCIAILLRAAVVARHPDYGKGRPGFLLPCRIHSKALRMTAIGPHGSQPDTTAGWEQIPPHTAVEIADRAAVDWIERGVSLKIIARWLARAGISTLCKRYRKYIALQSLRPYRQRFGSGVADLVEARAGVRDKTRWRSARGADAS